MIEIITSRGWRIEMSDDRLVLHHRKTDELREFECFEDAHASVMADIAREKGK